MICPNRLLNAHKTAVEGSSRINKNQKNIFKGDTNKNEI